MLRPPITFTSPGLERRLNEMEGTVGKIDQRLGGMDSRMSGHDEEIRRIYLLLAGAGITSPPPTPPPTVPPPTDPPTVPPPPPPVVTPPPPAPAPAGTYSATSPHWTHINVADFGRGYEEGTKGIPWNATRNEAAVQWYAGKIDMTENGTVEPGKTTHLRTYNSTLQVMHYDLDVTVFANDPELPSLPENYFLHVSDATHINWMNRNGQTGTTDLAAGDRYKPMVWTDHRYVWNLKNAACRNYLKARLLARTGSAKYLFLDEHGQNFQVMASTFWPKNQITTGGTITEYGGAALSVDNTSCNAAYQADLLVWLAELSAHFAAAGKGVFINPATDAQFSECRSQAIAANGMCTEFTAAPQGFIAAWRVTDIWNCSRTVFNAGGSMLYTGNWQYIPAGYTAGNYTTPAQREHMYRLGFYYLMKEPAGSTGKAWFDATLQSYTNIYDVPADQSDWLLAYEYNVGLPDAGYNALDATYTGTSPGGKAYTIFSRPYANAKILLRPREDDAVNWDDPVTVALGANYKLLNADGTLGSTVTNATVRSGEAVIMVKA